MTKPIPVCAAGLYEAASDLANAIHRLQTAHLDSGYDIVIVAPESGPEAHKLNGGAFLGCPVITGATYVPVVALRPKPLRVFSLPSV